MPTKTPPPGAPAWVVHALALAGAGLAILTAIIGASLH